MTTSYANERYLFVESEGNTVSERVVFELTSLEGDNASCRIYDEEGLLVYVDDFEIDRTVRKFYNLELLSNGNYKFVLKDDTQTIEYEVIKGLNGINITEQPEITYRPSIFKGDENTINFHLLALGKNVKVELLNTTGNGIYTQDFTSMSTVSKKFNMKNSPKGEYTFRVEVGNDVYYEYITI